MDARRPSRQGDARPAPAAARRCRRRNTYLRYYLIQAANSVRVREPEYAAFCERKYREARLHKRALVLTARKLTGLVFALLNEGQIYQPRRKTC